MDKISQPQVSAIIPCYNSAKYLPEAIESVLNQTYDNIEIIVVNDGSTDDTDEVLKPYLDRIKYIKQVNAGPAAARNKGIADSEGEYIAFLDADDIWTADKTRKQMEIIGSSSDVAMVYSKFENFCGDTGEKLSVVPDTTPSGFLFDLILQKNIIALPSVLARKSRLLEAGCFDQSLITAEDTNLWLKIAYKYPITAIPEVLFFRRMHKDNISSRVDIEVGTLYNLDLIVKTFPAVSPGKYTPMKIAYMVRGSSMAVDLFYGGEYNRCHDVCKRLINMRIINITILKYYLGTFLPEILIGFLRKTVKKTFQRASDAK